MSEDAVDLSTFEIPEVPELPDLHQGMLDEATLATYFADLQEHAEVFDVNAKGAPESYASDSPMDLAAGENLFQSGLVRGLQIRYRFGGVEWWDTLIRAPEGVRLVRIEHNFGGA